jgi:AraC-like DNA-binding protein
MINFLYTSLSANRRQAFLYLYCKPIIIPAPLEILPAPALQPYIEKYVVYENEHDALVKVLPGTQIVMGFQFSGRVALQDAGQERWLSTAGVTGVPDTFRFFRYQPQTTTLLVYFRPWGAAMFLPMPMHELHGHSIALADVLPPALVRETEEQMAATDDTTGKARVIDTLLIQLLHDKPVDRLVQEALHQIISSTGNERIGTIAQKLHISQRQLERRFRAVAGTSPKQFASLVRFQYLLKAKPQPSLTALGYEAGYADQSHFIREFERYTGVKPGEYFD